MFSEGGAGFKMERDLNVDYARRVVVGYSVSLISGMVRSRAWYQWAPQCPPSSSAGSHSYPRYPSSFE